MNGAIKTLLTVDISRPGVTLGTAIDDRSALGQVSMAEEFIVAASILMRDPDEESRLIRAKLMLIGQSIELCLKAFLLNKGHSREGLRKPPYNYDLKALLEACEGYDDFILAVEHRATIRDIAPPMSAFFFRYGNGEAESFDNLAVTWVPRPQSAFDAACALFSSVSTSLSVGRWGRIHPIPPGS